MKTSDFLTGIFMITGPVSLVFISNFLEDRFGKSNFMVALIPILAGIFIIIIEVFILLVTVKFFG